MQDTKTTNILMAGVGGQGVILASEIVAEAMLRAGYDVKKSEVHGMAQRGGSVTSHLRFGTKVYSPIIPDGEVDILFSFELLETLRYVHMLGAHPLIIVNNQKILPPSVIMGKDHYPDNIPDLLSQYCARVHLVSALDIARSAGNPKALNVAFVGALSRHIDIPESIWHDAIAAALPPKIVDLNIKAFTLARQNQ
ncbi:MAG: indolepyruvate oxidoreductase subunit beta [Desulfobacterota bacterium]|nr:indolepyruvate oxidoreductase subunit beta [Thermodesulfobacteriota bacterium]